MDLFNFLSSAFLSVDNHTSTSDETNYFIDGTKITGLKSIHTGSIIIALVTFEQSYRNPEDKVSVFPDLLVV